MTMDFRTCPCSAARPKQRFEWPYFVAPHAVRQFQLRIAPIPAAEAIEAVQQMLQNPGLPVDAELRDGQLSLIYRGWYAGRLVYIPVAPGEREWPCVPTVWGVQSPLHRQLAKERKHRAKHGRYPMRYWTERETQILAALRQAGLSIRLCAAIMRRGHMTIWRRLIGDVRPGHAWPERDVERALAMRARRRTCAEIADRLGRTSGAVSIRLYRHRRRHMSDPRIRRLVGLLSRVPPGPGHVRRALSTIKREALV